jgi:hypothetical protein
MPWQRKAALAAALRNKAHTSEATSDESLAIAKAFHRGLGTK